jgi:hypothetical protein
VEKRSVGGQASRSAISGFTAGLRGTGSQDFRIDDMFVPAERTVPLGAFFVVPTSRPSTAYRRPFYDVAGAQIAAVGLGIAPRCHRLVSSS